MKTYCIKDHSSGHIFKVFVTEEKFQQFLKENPDIDECFDFVECEDASSISLE